MDLGQPEPARRTTMAAKSKISVLDLGRMAKTFD
jgi:hypothetical protein